MHNPKPTVTTGVISIHTNSAVKLRYLPFQSSSLLLWACSKIVPNSSVLLCTPWGCSKIVPGPRDVIKSDNGYDEHSPHIFVFLR